MFFRSKATGALMNPSEGYISDQAIFYDNVLAHGDGTIKNSPDKSQGGSNLGP